MLKSIPLRAMLASIFCALSATAGAADNNTHKIEVPAGDLAAALQRLAEESGAELVYSMTDVRGRHTEGVRGEYTIESAVMKLLEGTKLNVTMHDSGAFLISGGATSTATAQRRLMRLAQAGPRATTDSTTAAASDRDPVEQVTVTAQRREERALDVPISMSVLNGRDLDRSTGLGTSEALSRVPGVSVDQMYLGGGTQVTVRGVPPSGVVIAGPSPVAYYLDSMPFGLVKTTIAPDTNAFDLQRVEVLRGPQGTLYGASALSGVVRILTREANLDQFELKGRGQTSRTEDGDWSYRGDAAVNVPIIDGKLAVRGVVGYQDISGWIDKPNQPDANDGELRNYRLKVSAKPTDALSLSASGWISRSDYGAPSISATGLTSSSTNSEPLSTDYDAYEFKGVYDFPGVTFSSMTSYLDYENSSVLDLQPGLAPRTLLTQIFGRVFAEEINVTSNFDGSWRWSGGAIYRKANDHRFQHISNIATNADVTDTSESSAVFGEATLLMLGRRVELTGGGRYFEDRVVGIEDSRIGAPAIGGVYSRRKFTKFSPRAVLTWHASDEMTTYASYSEGFRSGFHQNPTVTQLAPTLPPSRPDTLKNYEIGAKAELMDKRLYLESSVYYIDWVDVQQNVGVENPSTGVCCVSASLNGKSASGVGVDFAVSVQPTDGLELGLNFNWNDLELDSNVFSSGLLLFAKGERLAYSPKYTANVSLDYQFALGSAGYKGRFDTSASWTSPRDVVEIVGGSRIFAESDRLLIGRASFAVTAPRNWTADLYVENLTNENGIATAASIDYRREYVRPRTVGLQFEYSF